MARKSAKISSTFIENFIARKKPYHYFSFLSWLLINLLFIKVLQNNNGQIFLLGVKVNYVIGHARLIFFLDLSVAVIYCFYFKPQFLLKFKELNFLLIIIIKKLKCYPWKIWHIMRRHIKERVFRNIKIYIVTYI